VAIVEKPSSQPVTPAIAAAPAAPPEAISKPQPQAVAAARSAPPPEPAPRAPGNNGGGGGGVPGPAVAAADPAPMSESESDAFSRVLNVSVPRNGKITARRGREFKSVKPRLELKGWLDITSLRDPSVVMRVKVDETGKVMDVRVIKSSGSENIDLPTTLAMYKWWIEPGKDKQGKPVPDVVVITFSFL
jgi:TonB family protein